MSIVRKIIVTCALPYANGSLHLGHMLEHIQADIWVRYNRMQGHRVYFICADDAHGTPIMIKAKKLGISPERLINKINIEHKSDFSKFNISFDNYHSTHSEENYKLSILIYNRLKNKGLIKNRNIFQLFDYKKKMFLPDRFIRGNCPKCYSKDQFGDNCEICGAIYNSIDIINPKSIISNTVPIIKKSEHFFFDLPVLTNVIYKWISSNILQKPVFNKIQEWFKLGLEQWDISRDSPYFGFRIPDSPKKFFYVWLDAPIGYMGSFKNFCKRKKNIDFNEFWNVDSKTELYHFIGKDIIYFHCLFWPAILEASKFRKPNNIFVHGYVTINGKKMSKSNGTFIKASTYLKYIDPDCLRYYYASKLSSKIDDIDLNLKDFIQKFNSDIINKIINLASRSANFINKRFNNYLSSKKNNSDIYKTFINSSNIIGNLFNKRETNKAVKKIIELSNLANHYINEKAPWKIAKQKNKEEELHEICSMGINLFRILIIYLKPILPSLAIRVENFLNDSLSWNSINKPLLSHKIKPFKKLFSKISNKQIELIVY